MQLPFLLSACGLFRPPVEAPVCPSREPSQVCKICEVQQCPAPEIVEKIVEVPAAMPPMATTAGKMHFPIVGAVEWVTVEPGEDGRPTRGADRIRTEEIVESDTLRGEPVDVGRRIERRESGAEAADRVGRVIVRHDEQDVGAIRRGFFGGRDGFASVTHRKKASDR